MQTDHPLVRPAVIRSVSRAASAHLGRPWVTTGFTDLNDRASHPCGILRGDPFSVFAKLGRQDHFVAEIRGHTLVRRQTPVAVPVPIGDGVLETEAGWLLLLEAVPEIPAEARTFGQWQTIGRALATLHQTHDQHFGLDFNGFFGPLPQDNRPVTSGRWADFYAERRLLPRLRSAVDSGHLPAALTHAVEQLVNRLPALCGPEPQPSLLHGDAQQNNFLTSTDEAVLVDLAPCFGHPEIDLALLDYFAPVPLTVFDAYREVSPIDPAFEERRELWRLYGYLAVVTVDGASPFGRPFVQRIADAVGLYR